MVLTNTYQQLPGRSPRNPLPADKWCLALEKSLIHHVAVVYRKESFRFNHETDLLKKLKEFSKIPRKDVSATVHLQVEEAATEAGMDGLF